MGLSYRSAPTKPTGHTDTFFVQRIWNTNNETKRYIVSLMSLLAKVQHRTLEDEDEHPSIKLQTTHMNKNKSGESQTCMFPLSLSLAHQSETNDDHDFAKKKINK